MGRGGAPRLDRRKDGHLPPGSANVMPRREAKSVGSRYTYIWVQNWTSPQSKEKRRLPFFKLSRRPCWIFPFSIYLQRSLKEVSLPFEPVTNLRRARSTGDCWYSAESCDRRTILRGHGADPATAQHPLPEHCCQLHKGHTLANSG